MGKAACPKPVVDVHHRNPGHAGIKHREERGQPAEARTITDRSRDRNNGLVHESAHNGGEGAFHAGDNNNYPCGMQGHLSIDKPVNTGDSDIINSLDLAPEKETVTAASSATGMSDVPAESTRTWPFFSLSPFIEMVFDRG